MRPKNRRTSWLLSSGHTAAVGSSAFLACSISLKTMLHTTTGDAREGETPVNERGTDERSNVLALHDLMVGQHKVEGQEPAIVSKRMHMQR